MIRNNNVTLLDGAMGSALRDRGVQVPDHKTSIWSALALIQAPHAVRDLHRDYIQAGCDVITTNNYAATPISLARENMQHRLEELVISACDLANEARSGQGAKVKVAGSLPPLNTSYRPDLVLPFEQLLSDYRKIAKLLAPRCDLIICETLTTSNEALAAATAGAETNLPLWISFSLSDNPGNTENTLRGGEPVQLVIDKLKNLPIDVFLINCTAVNRATATANSLLVSCDKPIGIYANPFRFEPDACDISKSHPDYMDAETYASATRDWYDSGVSVIGGCCGTDPEFIAAIKKKLF